MSWQLPTLAAAPQPSSTIGMTRPGPDFHIAPENLKMEQILLFVVDDAFQITGRGCILVPGPSVEPGAQTVRIGDAIRLRKSDENASTLWLKAWKCLGGAGHNR
jgi:hypothetical protein